MCGSDPLTTTTTTLYFASWYGPWSSLCVLGSTKRQMEAVRYTNHYTHTKRPQAGIHYTRIDLANPLIIHSLQKWKKPSWFKLRSPLKVNGDGSRDKGTGWRNFRFCAGGTGCTRLNDRARTLVGLALGITLLVRQAAQLFLFGMRNRPSRSCPWRGAKCFLIPRCSPATGNKEAVIRVTLADGAVSYREEAVGFRDFVQLWYDLICHSSLQRRGAD